MRYRYPEAGLLDVGYPFAAAEAVSDCGVESHWLSQFAAAVFADSDDAIASLTDDATVSWANERYWEWVEHSRACGGSVLTETIVASVFSAHFARALQRPLLTTERVCIDAIDHQRIEAIPVALTPIQRVPRAVVLARFKLTSARLKRVAALESALCRATNELALLALDGDPARDEPVTRRTLLPLPADLPIRQREVAALILQRNDVDEIAGKLALSPHTVRNHLKAVFRRLGVHTRAELMARFDA